MNDLSCRFIGIDFPVLGTDERKIIEFYYDAHSALIYNTTEDIRFDGIEYQYGDYDKCYYELSSETMKEISHEEVLKRLDCFMRKYKLEKIISKI